ncbi:CynX/NimT family MFS transporter [Variovorax sp. HJSM1_2]|uniref:CynX/NimT family MFS transporter n=1 Tax=Variovorax sp. HJSM1_2 TaxID=3366263 RepID=UPI003BD62EED
MPQPHKTAGALANDLASNLANGLATEAVDAEANGTPQAPPTPVRSRAQHVLLGISMVLIGLNLRPVFSSVSALLPEIMAGTGMSAGGASLLTSIPILCLGLFAPLAPRLAMRFGTEKALLGILLLLLAGSALRGTGSVAWLFIASGMAGAAIAMGNVLMPGLVKRDFSAKAGLMTGLYTMAVCAGAAAAAGLTLPLSHALGDRWDLALAAWALPVILVAALWTPQALRAGRAAGGRHTGLRVRGLWRDKLAWQVTLYMGLQSGLAYAVMGWLAPILRDRGLDGVTAGWVISASVMTQVFACLLLPSFAIRLRNQSLLNVVLALLAGVCLLAMLFAPLTWVWPIAVVLGLAQGGLFSVCMTLIVLRTPDAHVAAQLSSMAQSVGYLIASTGPFMIGRLHEWTGSYGGAAWVFIVTSLGAAWFGFGAGRAMLVKAQVTQV